MGKEFGNSSLFIYLYLMVMLLDIFAYHARGQVFASADHSLTLTGPNEEDMMICSMPIPLPGDTHVQWYVNGKVLKVEFLPKNTLNLYESIQDLANLLGDYPQTVQCVIIDGTVNYVPVISDKVTIPKS